MNATTTYQKFAQFYDAYVQDFAHDLEFYTTLCQPEDRLLEIGCGTGRVLKYVLERGYSITGVDISHDMLDVARQKLHVFVENGQLRLLNHDFQHAPLENRYDKILVTFYTFNYILEQPETFLRHLAASLVPGGLLVMDLFYPHTLAHPEDENVWREKAWHFQQRVIHLKDKRTVRDNIEERIQIYIEGDEEIDITTHRKYYAPDDITQLLKSAGFHDTLVSAAYASGYFQATIPESRLSDHFLVRTVKQD